MSGEELQLRQEKYHRSQQVIETKRAVNAEREEARWRAIESSKIAEDSYWNEQRELGIKVIMNKLEWILHLFRC